MACTSFAAAAGEAGGTATVAGGTATVAGGTVAGGTIAGGTAATVGSQVFTAAAAAATAAVVGSLLAPKPGSPTIPGVTPPTPMPMAPGDKERAKAEQSILQGMSGMSRASSILTGNGGTLG